MMAPAWVQSTAGAVLSFGFGAADLWQFHALDKTTDLLLMVGGLAALGVHVAFTTGKASS